MLPMMLFYSAVKNDKFLYNVHSTCVSRINGLEDRDKIIKLVDSSFLKHLNRSIELRHKS